MCIYERFHLVYRIYQKPDIAYLKVHVKSPKKGILFLHKSVKTVQAHRIVITRNSQLRTLNLVLD
jgi:hypothetical protein